MKSLHVISVAALLIVSGCSKRQKLTTSPSSLIDIRQYEASLSDISTPLNSQPIEESFQQDSVNGLFLAYAVSLAPQKFFEFYEQEMDRYGWRCLAKFCGEQESLLIFDKPDRYCSISLRQATRQPNRAMVFKNNVIIVTGTREEGYSG